MRLSCVMLVAALLACSPSDAGPTDETIRFDVIGPSTVTVERLASGGFRITIVPMDPDSVPVPPKEEPAEDTIGNALEQLPEPERRSVAALFDARALVAMSNSGAFNSFEEAGAWLLLGVDAQIDDAFADRYADALSMLAYAIVDMGGNTLPVKLMNYRKRLAEVLR